MSDRAILHVDMNNFYASVETVFNPEYKDCAVAVAGNPEKRHGIILAKNQKAKAKGVQTGEAIWISQKKCPELVLLPPHHERYEEYSKKAIEIYSRFTDQVESFGIDECWLDITGSQKLFGSPLEIAEKIRKAVKDELSLTVSIGVSFNKIFAKLGSDYKKPDAITEISRENFKKIVWELPVSELLCVGKSTKNTLEKCGIFTIGELANIELKTIEKILGKNGFTLWHYANGLDNAPVTTLENKREVKSISNSTTTPKDLKTDEEVKQVLYFLAEKVAHRLRKNGLWANSVQISIKRSNLEYYQKSCTLQNPSALSQEIFDAAYTLYKKSKEPYSIRSLGIKADKLSHDGFVQSSLFCENNFDSEMKLEKTKDELRKKYGIDSLKRAVLIEK
ncbi:MAG: DNA polymerase IV [Clostridia bacterium]